MSYAANLLPEFDHEMSNTEKILECVTVDLMNWRAEESMNTIGWNANHLAEIPGWVEGILTKLEWDIAPVGEQPYQSPALSDPQAILELFRTNVQTGRQAIEQVQEQELGKMWKLLHAGETMIAMPRSAMLRTFVMNHLIHHRGHLSAYLKMNGVETPPMYGG